MKDSVIIYYKDYKLDKYRTAKSLIKYYIKCWINKQKPRKITVDSSVN